MKRSQINAAYHAALACFTRHHRALPPSPKWDITDFGLGDFERYGLVLINLADHLEYCEKLMWARRGQTTPCHAHDKKKEDVICRVGELTLELWPAKPASASVPCGGLTVPVDGEPRSLARGERLVLAAGSRVTLVPGVWHAFYPSSEEGIIGEVSTANDDDNDNLFLDPKIGRFPQVDEDEAPAVRLLSDKG